MMRGVEIDAPEGTRLVTDTSVGDWIAGHLHPWASPVTTVATFVPAIFEAYARIFHPLPAEHGAAMVRWADVAEPPGRLIGPETTFDELSGREPATRSSSEEPERGTLAPDDAETLAGILERFTTTPERCWLAIWEGWNFISDRELPTMEPLRLHLPGRDYYLFAGPVRAAGRLAVTGVPQSPNMWWPDDRAWFVATDVDYFCTYLGGSSACIRSVLDSAALDAVEVTPSTKAGPGDF